MRLFTRTIVQGIIYTKTVPNCIEIRENAIDKLNGMLMNDKQVYVDVILCKQNRECEVGNSDTKGIPVKELTRFVNKGKLSPRFIGPSENLNVLGRWPTSQPYPKPVDWL
jgi:hypothetical protein